MHMKITLAIILIIISTFFFLSSIVFHHDLSVLLSIGIWVAGCIPFTIVIYYRKSIHYTWIVGFLAFIIFLAGLEAGLSVGKFKYRFLPRNTGSEFKTHPYLFWVPGQGPIEEKPLGPPKKYTPVPFDKETWSPSYSLNSSPEHSPLNFRSGPVDINKPEGRIRIVTLGGSNAWGHGVDDYNNTLTGHLESKIKKTMPEKDIEFISAGVQGYRLFHVLVLYKLYIRNYKPDIIIVYANNNDTYAEYAPFTWRKLFKMRSGVDISDLWINEFDFPKHGSALFKLQDELQRLKTYNLLTEWITDIRREVLPGKEDSWLLREVNPLEDYKQNLIDLITIVNKDGGKLILADAFAYFYIGQHTDSPKDDNRREWMKKYMNETARDFDATFVPIHDLFTKFENLQRYVFDPPHEGHINAEGHRAVADILNKVIIEKNLLE